MNIIPNAPISTIKIATESAIMLQKNFFNGVHVLGINQISDICIHSFHLLGRHNGSLPSRSRTNYSGGALALCLAGLEQ